MPSPAARANYLVERLLQRAVGLENQLPATRHEALTQLGQQYGFTVVTDAALHDSDTCFEPSSAHQQDRFADLLRQELALYHSDVIKACGLKRIILGQRLTSRDHQLAGLAELGLWLLGTLVINAEILERIDDCDRETFHHELFHAIDYRDDWSHYVDTDWSHLNAPGFRYNNDLAFVDMPPFDFRNVDMPEAGFLNTYATQNPYEDKATVYANMVVRYHFVMDRANQDQILANKVEYMKQLLERFHPSFDDSFWSRVQQIKHG